MWEKAKRNLQRSYVFWGSSPIVWPSAAGILNFDVKFGFYYKNPTWNRILRSGVGNLDRKVPKLIFVELLFVGLWRYQITPRLYAYSICACVTDQAIDLKSRLRVNHEFPHAYCSATRTYPYLWLMIQSIL